MLLICGRGAEIKRGEGVRGQWTFPGDRQDPTT